MLAQGGRGSGVADLALGPDRARHFPDAAEVRVVDFEDHLARPHLLVVERLRHGIHGRARHVTAQEGQPFGGRLLLEARGQDGDQLRLVGEALGKAREARVRGEVGQFEAGHQGLPELVLVAEDHDPAVLGAEVLGRHERLVAGAGDALGLPVAVERPDR